MLISVPAMYGSGSYCRSRENRKKNTHAAVYFSTGTMEKKLKFSVLGNGNL